MKSRILFLAVLVALVACSKDKDDDKKADNNNNPPAGNALLKVGNQWTYEFTNTTDEIVTTGDIAYKVLQDMGNGSYKVEISTTMEGVPPFTFEDVWTNDDLFGVGADLTNAKVGDSWTETDEGVVYTTTVVALSESVTVPAGTFSCIKLKSTQSDNEDIESYIYFHNSYGMIFSDITDIDEWDDEVIVTNVKMKLKSKNF